MGNADALRKVRTGRECRDERFFRLLAWSRKVFGDRAEYRAFTVVNGNESPSDARARINRVRAEGVKVELVCFTPHDWEHRRPFVNQAAGWTAEHLLAVQDDARF
jgi:hypothetical protein